MSYCRWSTDDFRCDLYIYDDVRGGVTIHVAGRRHDIPEAAYPPPLAEWDADAWLARHAAVSALIEKAPLVDIGLPHDGEDHPGLTYREAADKVRELVALGYRCPPGVLAELEAEALGEPDRSGGA